jgi:ketosteroid isomerase-like protein
MPILTGLELINNMKKYLILLFTMITMSGAAQQKTVEEAVETLKKLLVSPEAKALSDLTHKDLSYGHSSGKIENQSEFIDQLVSKRSDFRKVEFLDQTVVLEGKTAIVRHTLEADTFDGGKPGNVKLKILLVWVKDKKDWKLMARQAVRI